MPVYLLGHEIVVSCRSRTRRRACSPWAATSAPSDCSPPTRAVSFPGTPKDGPILWHSPDPRFVLTQRAFRVPGAFERTVRAGRYRVHARPPPFATSSRPAPPSPRAGPGRDVDHGRHEVRLCRAASRGLRALRRSVARRRRARRGALRCLARRRLFSASRCSPAQSDASKVAFATLVEQLAALGHRPHRLPGRDRAPRALRRRELAARALLGGSEAGPPSADGARSLVVRRLSARRWRCPSSAWTAPSKRRTWASRSPCGTVSARGTHRRADLEHERRRLPCHRGYPTGTPRGLQEAGS